MIQAYFVDCEQFRVPCTNSWLNSIRLYFPHLPKRDWIWQRLKNGSWPSLAGALLSPKKHWTNRSVKMSPGMV